MYETRRGGGRKPQGVETPLSGSVAWCWWVCACACVCSIIAEARVAMKITAVCVVTTFRAKVEDGIGITGSTYVQLQNTQWRCMRLLLVSTGAY